MYQSLPHFAATVCYAIFAGINFRKRAEIQVSENFLVDNKNFAVFNSMHMQHIKGEENK